MLFGQAALISKPSEYDLLTNWRMLVGETETKIGQEKLNDPALERILGKYSLVQIVSSYLDYIVSHYLILGDEKPQFIVGIPSTSSLSSKAARERYKKIVSDSFNSIGFPEPRFFQEPFATFQYHWNVGMSGVSTNGTNQGHCLRE